VTGIDACVNQEKFSRWIEDARGKGLDDGVTGTPTIKIDGKDVSGANNTIASVADIQKAIDAAKKS
jgi:protein-disulfide isomerase